MKHVYLLIAIFASIYCVNSYKILAVLPVASKSHYSIGNSIVNALLTAGHEVSVVQAFPSKGNVTNRHDIYIPEMGDFAKKQQSMINPFNFGDKGPILTQIFLYKMGKMTLEMLLSNHVFQNEVLNSKFDLVIYEIFGTDALVGLGQHFNCPVIGFTTFAATTWIDRITGNPPGPSYIPSSFLSYTAHMTFKQRLINTVFGYVEKLIEQLIYYPDQRALYKKFFPNSKSTFDDDLKNVRLVFINNHFSGSSPRHLLPNMIEISGIHVQKAKPLPEEWQKYLDDAKEGVVYFSMGSMIQSKDWPIEKRVALVQSLGKLKQKVVWKYENETLPDQPANVRIGKWFPQRDILAHPNVKVFITHGGLLGTTEALVAGVPVIGIPIYGDQKLNIARAKETGYGLVLNMKELTEDKVTAALREMLDNPKYYETAQRISKQFNDRPLTPQQSVVYWSEYVIRHNGATHLKSSSNDLSFIQFHLIDVYALLFIIVVLCFIISVKSTKFLIKKIFAKSKPNRKQKQN